MSTIKSATIESCKFTSEWLNPANKKIIYYHEVTTSLGDLASCGTMEKNSPRIAVGAKIEYSINENGRLMLHSSSNDKKEEKKEESTSKDSKSFTSNRIKGQEAFLGYAWSYAKDLIIAGKTSKDMEELNAVARYIYDEIGLMLLGEPHKSKEVESDAKEKKQKK